MSKAANKTMIGAFVLGALVLLVLAVVIFGSGSFFKKKQSYEMFFQGSVQGLDVGSPVMFRGVKVGTVKDISLEFKPEELAFYIPVIAEVELDRMKRLGPPPKKEGEYLKPLIDKGLRAQLQTTSFVTGQLAVSLDFFPDKPAHLVGLAKKYPEVPTVPSTFAQLTKTIQDLPIQALFAKLDATMGSIQELVSSDAARTSMASLDRLLKQASGVMKNIDGRIGPLVVSLQNTSDGFSKVAGQLNASLSGDQGIPTQLQATLESTRKTLAQAEQTLASVQAVTEQNSTMGYDLGAAITEMSRSMRSLRALSDYLERHPEALIRGKKAS